MSKPIFMFDEHDPAMQQAYKAAQQSFKYFWRELSWERRRIVPGLDMSTVKLPFTDGPRTDGNPEHEYMWASEVDFDGETLSGQLLNAPNWLTSVREGDSVRVPFSHLADWMMTVDGVAYGAFTVNVMRARMSSRERKEHDQAWGLDFGDPAESRVEIVRGEKARSGFLSGLLGSRSRNSNQPSGFKDHPMCVNMLAKIEEQLKADASIAQSIDEDGWTLLQREALAGNLGVVKLLVGNGAEVARRTPAGRTAAELAQGIGWSEIGEYLDEQTTKSGY